MNSPMYYLCCRIGYAGSSWNCFRRSTTALASSFDKENLKVDRQVLVEKNEDILINRFRDVNCALPVHSYTLTPYVNQSHSLKSLLALGVDVSRLEKYPKFAERIVKMDFQKDIFPYLSFLQVSGVSDDAVGQVINRFPLLLNERIDDLNFRVEYLKSYGFSNSKIGVMVSSSPKFLGMLAEGIAKKLNLIKDEFSLTTDQNIGVVSKCPRLLTFDDDKLKFNKLALKEIIGLSEIELQTVLITSPRIFTTGQQQLASIFDYLRHVMDIKPSQIVKFPQVFRSRLRRIEHRHKFLESLNRDQYDPKLPNFVSLHALVSGNDESFAEKVAMSTVERYNLFLKTL